MLSLAVVVSAISVFFFQIKLSQYIELPKVLGCVVAQRSLSYVCYCISFFLVMVLIWCFICKLSSRLGATIAPHFAWGWGLSLGGWAVLSETTLPVGGHTHQYSVREGWCPTHLGL